MQEQHTDKKRDVVSSFEDNQQATVDVAKIAQRGLAIYTPDLEPGIYDHEDFIAVVKRLVLSKRYASVCAIHQSSVVGNDEGFLMVFTEFFLYIAKLDVTIQTAPQRNQPVAVSNCPALL